MAKGGAYENTVARKIAKAFRKHGITEDDVYRTKNSGATKKQPGDIQLSPVAVKVFPAVIECKHYKRIVWIMGKPIHNQNSYLKKWWKQVEQEQRDAPERFSILIFRPNRCPDMAAFVPKTVGKFVPLFPHIRFNNIIKTKSQTERIWIVPLKLFLKKYKFAMGLTKGTRNDSRQGTTHRNGPSPSASRRKVPQSPRTQLGTSSKGNGRTSTNKRSRKGNAG